MKLASEPAKAVAVWQLVGTVICLGFASWFLYNGAIRWPHRNRQRAAERLAVLQPFASQLSLCYDELPSEPSKASFDEFPEARPLSADWVHRILGEPQITQEEERGTTREYYVSQWGYGIVTYRSVETVLGECNWHRWYRTKGDIRQQYILAVVACIPGLYFLWKLRGVLGFSSASTQSNAEHT
jgi:hypothetical protein